MFNEEMPNRNVYLDKMEKTLLDKALFMSHIDADIIVDFGCANGALIKFLSKLFPEKHFIGYDISYRMIEAASLNLRGHDNVYLYFMWEDVVRRLKNLKKFEEKHKTCLVCSSVIHEVYSYSTKDEIREFWKIFWGSDFDYIAIRDMYRNFDGMISNNYQLKRTAIRKWSDYTEQCRDFEKWWGELETVNDFNHFFLKYFYKENWERELKENYLPQDYSTELLLTMKNEAMGYKSIFSITYVLPYIKERVKEDFGLDLIYPTHFQKILKKVDY